MKDIKTTLSGYLFATGVLLTNNSGFLGEKEKAVVHLIGEALMVLGPIFLGSSAADAKPGKK